MATKKLTLDKVLKMAQLLEKFGRTGDWTLALCHRLKEEIKRLNIKHLPNQTSQEMINRAKNFK